MLCVVLHHDPRFCVQRTSLYGERSNSLEVCAMAKATKTAEFTGRGEEHVKREGKQALLGSHIGESKEPIRHRE